MLSSFTFAQELKITRDGIEPIVVEVEGMTAEEIYKKAIRWVQETYDNPRMALKADIPNEKIRLDGYAKNAFWYRGLGVVKSYFDVTYTLEIAFKEGRYKYNYTINKIFSDGKIMPVELPTYFKKEGEVKQLYKDLVPSLDESLNEFHQSFYNYVTGVTKTADDNW